MTGALVVFAVSLAACLYIYFGYPALIFLLSRLRSRPVGREDIRPSVSLIIPVYNEAKIIEEKIKNSLALQYPPDNLEILVLSDGSTDATNEIVQGYASARLRLLCLERRGKALALNQGARQARGEILVFTDANSLLEPQSLIYLVENFADPEVGGVCGNKKYRPRSGADATEGGEDLYWRYDKWQKGLESRMGSIFAADGAFYAVRKNLYVPIEDPAQADDIAVSTRVVLQGYRLLFEHRAVAWEEAPEEGRSEFKRKIRVTNHSVRALLQLGSDLWTSGFYSVELLSHKFFRHLVPFFLIPLFLSNLLLASAYASFLIALLAQVLFYASALAGFAMRRNRLGQIRLLAIPYYFCLVNAAALLGVLSILRRERLPAWTPRGGLRA